MTLDCTAARALLLEADPAELRGEIDSPLAAHLRGYVDFHSRQKDLERRAVARFTVHANVTTKL